MFIGELLCSPCFASLSYTNNMKKSISKVLNFQEAGQGSAAVGRSNFSLASCWMVALARKRPSLLLEEKVSPVGTLVTDVVENVTNSPAVSGYRTIYRTPHQSQIGSEEPICASFSSRRSLCLCGANCSRNPNLSTFFSGKKAV